MALTPLGPARLADADSAAAPRPRVGTDDRVRSVAPAARILLAVLLVAASPLVDGAGSDDEVRFGLFVAFGWIPAAGVISMIGRRRPGLAIDLAALAVDLTLVGMVQVLLAPSVGVLLAGQFLLVAAYTYMSGRWIGALAGLCGLGLGLAVAVVSSERSGVLDPFTMAVFPPVLVVLAWLLDAAATEQWRASTGLARLNEKSDAILTGVGEAVVVSAPDGRIAQWNRAAAMTFGCPAEEARGQRCSEVLALLHEVRELDCSRRCALLGLGRIDGLPVDVEVWRWAPTGQRQPLLASVSPVVDASGRVVEVVHSFRDITRLKQADEAKTLFLATASHELKTPLTVIRGFSQMLLLPEQMLGADERLAALRAIDARAGQLTNIVDRLLMSSRIEAGRIELNSDAVDLAPILFERADVLERATGRQVVLLLQSDLPHAWCDGDAFTTVLDHLLDNSVKYSPNGGPITISADAAGDGIDLPIADEGVGMTPEQAVHCFERFWQAEATDVRRFGGTGIGLYIVRSLVEGMGGSITVSTAPGAGCTFRVVLLRQGQVIDRDHEGERRGRGEQTMIREYMRQLGVRVEPASVLARAKGPS